MGERLWATMRAALMVTVLSARLAAADCAAPQPPTEQKTPAVYLGTYQDFAGHPASFFADAESFAVLSLEHVKGPAPKLAPGARGTVTGLRRGPQLDGVFVRFEPQGQPVDLATILEKLTDPFTLGLLAGKSPVQDAAAALALPGVNGERRQQFPAVALGVLYAADIDRAAMLFEPLRFRDLMNTDPQVLVVLARGTLKELSALSVKDPSGWTDWLPQLTKLWLEKPKNFRAEVTNLVFGSDLWAEHPIDQGFASIHECGSVRSGPFERLRDVGSPTLVALLKKKDPAYAKALVEALRGLSSFDKVYVVDTVDAQTVLLLGAAGGGFSLVTLPEQVPLFAPLKYLARRDPKAKVPRVSERLRGFQLGPPTKAERVGAQEPQKEKVLAELLGHVNNIESYAASYSLALYDAHGPRDVLWAHLLKLPGNTLEFDRSASAWAGVLGGALDVTRRCGLVADTLDHLPALLAAMVGKSKAADADALRKFLFNTFGPGVLVCLSAGDRDVARRAADVMGAELATLLPQGTALRPETDYRYSESRLLFYQDLVGALEGKARNPKSNVSFQADLFAGFTRGEDPKDVAAWANALAAQGYPAAKLKTWGASEP